MISVLSKGLRVLSAPQFEGVSCSVLSLLYGPTLTSIGKTLTLTMWTFVKGFGIVSESEVGGFGDFLAFSMIQLMLAI